MSRPIIVIFGATGNQGGSVIESLLSDPKTQSKYKLRGVTRDMVAANLNDASSVEKAIQGAYGVFAVTDYWASMDGPKEIQQGHLMADAAKSAGVQHFVLSTLKSPSLITNGALKKIEHFETKAEIAAYVTAIGLSATFSLPGFYMSNLPDGMFRKNGETGKYVLAMPNKADAQIPLLDAGNDTGKYVEAIFENREKLLGKEILASGKYYSPQEVVDQFTAAFPKDGAGASFMSIPAEAFSEALESTGMPNKGAEDLTENMLLLNRSYGYYGGASLDDSNTVNFTRPGSTWDRTLM